MPLSSINVYHFRSFPPRELLGNARASLCTNNEVKRLWYGTSSDSRDLKQRAIYILERIVAGS
jgi:hypothetical protein